MIKVKGRVTAEKCGDNTITITQWFEDTPYGKSIRVHDDNIAELILQLQQLNQTKEQ